MLRPLREFLQWRQGDSIILAEANVLPRTDMQYFGDDGDRMHMMFNFQVNQNLFYALASADTPPSGQGHARDRSPDRRPAQWGIFLRNHDELDLGRLTKRSGSGYSMPSAQTQDISSTIEASGAVWRRCLAATAAGSSSLIV